MPKVLSPEDMGSTAVGGPSGGPAWTPISYAESPGEGVPGLGRLARPWYMRPGAAPVGGREV